MPDDFIKCHYCKELKPRDAFVSGSKNPSKCLECRRKDLWKKKRAVKEVSDKRLSLYFDVLQRAILLAFKNEMSDTEANRRVYEYVYNHLDQDTRAVVNFHHKQLISKK